MDVNLKCSPKPTLDNAHERTQLRIADYTDGKR